MGKKKKRTGPTRACEKCETRYHPRKAACPNCGAANPTIGRSKPKKKVAPKKKKVARKKRAESDAVSMSALLEAKKLAAKLGGVNKAKQAINALSQLTD